MCNIVLYSYLICLFRYDTVFDLEDRISPLFLCLLIRIMLVSARLCGYPQYSWQTLCLPFYVNLIFRKIFFLYCLYCMFCDKI